MYLDAPVPVSPVTLNGMTLGNGEALFLIAGPCVIESKDTTLLIAERLKELTVKLEIPFIFKASYDKANRTSGKSFRGPGFDEGLAILHDVKEQFEIPVLSDVHSWTEAMTCIGVLDSIQIPAFLCRQTDLLQKAALTGKVINIKKGQFVGPRDIHNAVDKVREAAIEGDKPTQVMVTERGYCFGYNDLVVDMRGIPIMQQTCDCPVIFDAGHSVQKPGGHGDSTGGNRDLIPVLARAAIGAGCDGVFVETHPDPEKALSDGPNSYPLYEMENLLIRLKKLAEAVRGL